MAGHCRWLIGKLACRGFTVDGPDQRTTGGYDHRLNDGDEVFISALCGRFEDQGLNLGGQEYLM